MKDDMFWNTFDAMLMINLPLIPIQYEIISVQKNTMSLTVSFRNEIQIMSSEWIVPFYVPNVTTFGSGPAFVNASEVLVETLRFVSGTIDIRHAQYVCNNVHILTELFFKQNVKHDATITDIIDNIKDGGRMMLLLKLVVITYQTMMTNAGIHDAFLPENEDTDTRALLGCISDWG